jgi:radical SAM protein with 4Fe4S-binding SPASM domain
VGTSLIAIDPDGRVMPCHRYLYRPQDWFGTVDRLSFPSEREKYVRISTRELLGCDGCSAEPVCGGGCRLVVVSERLDLHSGVHPGHCLNTRAHARMAYRLYDTLMQEQPESFQAALRHDPASPKHFGELAI